MCWLGVTIPMFWQISLFGQIGCKWVDNLHRRVVGQSEMRSHAICYRVHGVVITSSEGPKICIIIQTYLNMGSVCIWCIKLLGWTRLYPLHKQAHILCAVICKYWLIEKMTVYVTYEVEEVFPWGGISVIFSFYVSFSHVGVPSHASEF